MTLDICGHLLSYMEVKECAPKLLLYGVYWQGITVQVCGKISLKIVLVELRLTKGLRRLPLLKQPRSSKHHPMRTLFWNILDGYVFQVKDLFIL